MRANEIITEKIKQRLDPKCWKGKHKEGTKIKGGVRVNNCVPNESVAEGSKTIPMSSDPETGKKHPDYGNTGMMSRLNAASQKRKPPTPEPEPDPNDLSKYNDFPNTNRDPWKPVFVGEPTWENIPRSLEIWARRKGIHRDIQIRHSPNGKIWTITGKSGYPHEIVYTYKWLYDAENNEFEPIPGEEQGVIVGEGWKENVGNAVLVALLSAGALHKLSDLVNSAVTGEPTQVITNRTHGINKINSIKTVTGQGIESIKSVPGEDSKTFEMTLTDGRKVTFTATDLERAKKIASIRNASEPIEVKKAGNKGSQ